MPSTSYDRYLSSGYMHYALFTDDERSRTSRPNKTVVSSSRRLTTRFVNVAHKYVCVEGDTLQGLAFRFYNDPLEWYVIADHNSTLDLLDIMSGIPAGTTIIIPRLSEVV